MEDFQGTTADRAGQNAFGAVDASARSTGSIRPLESAEVTLVRMIRQAAQADRAGTEGLSLLQMETSERSASLHFQGRELLRLDVGAHGMYLAWKGENSVGDVSATLDFDMTKGAGKLQLTAYEHREKLDHWGPRAVTAVGRTALLCRAIEQGPLTTIKKLAKLTEGTERANFAPLGLNSPQVRAYLAMGDRDRVSTVAGTVVDKSTDAVTLAVGKTRGLVVYRLKDFPELTQVQMLDNLVVRSSPGKAVQVGHLAPAEVEKALTRHAQDSCRRMEAIRGSAMASLRPDAPHNVQRTSASLDITTAGRERDPSANLEAAQLRARWTQLDSLDSDVMQAQLPRGSTLGAEAVASLRELLEDRFDGARDALSVRSVSGHGRLTLQVFGVMHGAQEQTAEVATYVYDKGRSSFTGLGVTQFQGQLAPGKVDAIREALAAPGVKLSLKVPERAVEVSSQGVALSQKPARGLER